MSPRIAFHRTAKLERSTRVASLLAVSLLLSALIVPGARAGEVRVNVGPAGNVFVPAAVTVNAGDHVVWVWTGSVITAHSSTSGLWVNWPIGDGIWDSLDQLGSFPLNGSSWSWMMGAGPAYQYFCDVHLGMNAQVNISAGVLVPDFRLTEVQYNEPSGHDMIEITNIGPVAGDLGRYRISVGATAVSIPADNVAVSPGATITIHTNEAGVNTATDLYMNTIGALGDLSGSVALYVPNTAATSLADITQAIDYVEWGAAGQANETTAINASNWTAASFVPTVAIGHSIQFCGTAAQHFAGWGGNASPSFSGAATDCLTPVQTVTWGRIKTLYR